MDYAHPVDNRPPRGTLTGYRDGAMVVAHPRRTCDITAHVALDACAEAGQRAGADHPQRCPHSASRCVLWGSPAHARRSTWPGSIARRYLQALARASEEAELIDSSRVLGGFGWLSQSR